MNKLATMNKKVLIISYYFPPAGGPGVQRILKFVKYLPKFGWEPVVVTVKDGDFPAIDESLCADILKNVSVYRIKAYEPYAIYRKITGKSKNEAIPVGVLAKNDDSSFIEKFAKWIRSNVFIPDARIGWIPLLNRNIKSIIDKEKPAVLLSSSPPHSLQIAARKIAKKFRLPWILDLRDPWTDIYYYQNSLRTKPAKCLDKYYEKKCLTSANTVLTVSPSIIRNLYENYNLKNLKLVYNGYDKRDIAIVNEPTPYDKFRISYIGNMKTNQNPGGLWKALKSLVETNNGFQKDLQIRLTGKIHSDIKIGLKQTGLLNYCSFSDYVPHSMAVRKMKEAAALLFIIPQSKDNRGILTGKIFEYLAVGRPLISVGPVTGDAAKIIRKAKGGEMYDYENSINLEKRILSIYQAWQTNNIEKLAPDYSIVENKYDREKLTEQLSKLLNASIEE